VDSRIFQRIAVFAKAMCTWSKIQKPREDAELSAPGFFTTMGVLC
jgi:hypothetical protein